MKKAIKKHSESYYLNAQEKIYNRLAELPRGTIKECLISGRKYFYLQCREGKKVIHSYIGKVLPRDLKEKMLERKALRGELSKIQDILMDFLTAKIRGL